MRMMRRLPGLLVMLPSLALAQSAPEGWTVGQEGREIAMYPPGLARGQVYVLSVQVDVDMRNLAPREFLARRAASQPKLGKQIKGGAIVATSNGGLVTERSYQRPNGSTLDATFALGKQANGKALLISIVCSPAACRAHNPAAMRWMQSPAAANIGKDATTGPPRQERSRRAVVKKKSEYQTDPGQGIAAGEIESVVVAKTPSGHLYPVLLLRNGDFYSDVDVPPEDLDVALFKKKYSRKWGKWRRRRGVLEMRDWRGKWMAASSWGAQLSTARPDEELSGQYANGSGSGSYSSLREIAFFPGHRFAVRRSASAAVYAGAGIGGGRTRRGTYRVDGHTIELQYDDGTIEREGFHWASDEKDAAFFNDRYHSRDAESP